jgi:lipopolysaccharide biosynthesis glycosyltransferase
MSGSRSDIVALVRMATESPQSTLPHDVETLLQSSGVLLRYLPKETSDNVYTANMAKFNILNLVEYSRVLYLDSDVMPLCNLDYIFHLSEGENALLRENVVIAWRTEPANGGFFMMRPDRDDYNHILDIQKKRDKQGADFDVVKGWGHAIQPPDQWVSRNGIKKGTEWTFNFADKDQGLLYHWVKYVKKNVSIINQDKVETWGTINNTKDGEVQMISMHRNIFHDGCSSSMPKYKFHWGRNVYPEKDFVHFTGDEKPWINKYFSAAIVVNDSQVVFDNPFDFWHHILRKVLSEKNRVTIKNLDTRPLPE